MIRTLMVHVTSSAVAAGHVEAAASLAERMSCRLIGMAAAFPPPSLTAEFGGAPPMLFQQLVDDAKLHVAEMERAFRAATSRLPAGDAQWRGAARPPLFFLPAQARAADIVLATAQPGQDTILSALEPADLVMGAGRPVMIVPNTCKAIKTRRVLIAWKDTVQARRAVQGAIGLLRGADRVLVYGAGSETTATVLEDVVSYLDSHDVAATALHEEPKSGAGAAIRAIAQAENMDLIVAGAYGHSRLREWILGGVTRDLLEHSPLPCLFTH